VTPQPIHQNVDESPRARFPARVGISSSPTSARSRSDGSISLCTSPLRIALFTRVEIACVISSAGVAQFGTNHLGHFVLVNRIVSLLRPGSRLVNLSSAAHRYEDVDLADPNLEHTPYVEFTGYGSSSSPTRWGCLSIRLASSLSSWAVRAPFRGFAGLAQRHRTAGRKSQPGQIRLLGESRLRAPRTELRWNRG
jgi:hypothetical protein